MSHYPDPALIAQAERERRLNAVLRVLALLLGAAPAVGFAATHAAAYLAAG